MWLQEIGGWVKRCTYVLSLGIAHFSPISKDVPKRKGQTIDLSNFLFYRRVSYTLTTPGEVRRVETIDFPL